MKEKDAKLKTVLMRLLRRVLAGTALLVITLGPLSTRASENWPGVDESVVEKVAEEYGRSARDPFINTDQGDLLLFVFLLAGAAGGFVGGYYWRILVEDPTEIDTRKGRNAPTHGHA